MANPFPVVNFDWLGELPGIAKAARDDQYLKQTLADLPSTSPDALEKKSAELIRNGFLKEGTLLQDKALAQRQLAQKGEADRAYQAWVDKFGGKIAPGAALGTTEPPPPDIPFPGKTAPAASAPAATDPTVDWGTNPLASPGRRSALEPQPQSPSDQLITAAQQGGAPAPPAQVALAGEPPTPDSTPAAPGLPAQLPPFMQGAQAQPKTTAPVAPVAPVAPATPTYGPIGGNEDQQARAEAIRIGQQIATMPPKAANTPEGKALYAQYTSALSRLKLSKDEQDYQKFRVQLAQEGKPDISRTDFELYKRTAPDRLKEAHVQYAEYAKDEKAGIDLGTKLTRMNEIVNHPNFVSGELNHLDFAKKGLANLLDTLEASGVNLPVNSRDVLTSNDPTVLKEAFTSIAGQGVIAALGGSLGRGISSSDQQYMARTFPDLLKSKEGIRLVSKILGDIAERHKLSGKIARQYITDSGMRATAPGMDGTVNDALEQYGKDNPLFTDPNGGPSRLAERVSKIIEGYAGSGGQGEKSTSFNRAGGNIVPTGVDPLAGGGQQAGDPLGVRAPVPAPRAAPQAPPAEAMQGRALNGPKTPANPSGRYRQLPSGQIVPEGTQGT